MSAAGYALGRLNQAAQQVSFPTLLQRPTLRREAQSTSALEGTFAPLDDVLAADVLAATSWSTQLREVLNYVDAAEAAFSWLAEDVGSPSACYVSSNGSWSKETRWKRIRAGVCVRSR
ncbi:MAG TPA: Fic/DOC family N-terminal domain-containing protein [Pseudonocardiaceae bacterium]|nr:Fic/DOC family N-terminal domain-containing protein [Pseudonocardiaceae bacterium]